MTDYTVTVWPTAKTTYNTLAEALAALETKLETIVNTKTIRLISVHPVGPYWEAALIYDT